MPNFVSIIYQSSPLDNLGDARMEYRPGLNTHTLPPEPFPGQAEKRSMNRCSKRCHGLHDIPKRPGDVACR